MPLKLIGEEPAPDATAPPPPQAGGVASKNLKVIDTEAAPLKTTQTEAGGEGFTQGLSYNYADELAAAIAAAKKDRLPDETYEQAVQRHFAAHQEKLKAAEAEHPVTYYGTQAAGGIVGSLVNPVAGAKRLAGTVEGAVEGAVSGYGSGETEPERLLNAGIGGIGGAAGGFISPELGKVGSLAARKAGRPVIDWISSMLGGPGGVRQVAKALEQAGISPEDAKAMIDEAIQRGQPMTLGDVADRPGGRLAQTSSNLNPVAGMEISDVVNARNEERVNRFRNYMTSLIPGYGNTAAERAQLRDAARAANKGAYDVAYQKAPGGLWDQELMDISTSPAMQQAIRDAEKKSAERAVGSGGVSTLRNPFKIDPNTGVVTLKDPNVTPSLEFWDQVQRNLREQQEEAGKGFFPGSKSSAAGDIGDTQRRLLKHLDTTVPEFGAARGQAHTFFQASDSIDLGQKLAADHSLTPEAFQQGLKSLDTLSPADKRLVKASYVDALAHRAGQSTENRDIARVLMGSENDKAIQLALFGKDTAAKMDAFQKAEGLMQVFSTRALGGSQTAERAMDLLARTGAGTILGGTAGATAGLYQGKDEKTLGGTGAAIGGLAGMIFSGTKGAVGRHTALTAAKYLVSDKAGDREAVYKMMRASPEIRDAVAAAAARLGGMLAGQTSDRMEDQPQ